MSGKYAQNIVSGVKTVRSLPYHKPDKFFYPLLMSGKRVPGAKMWCYYFFLHPNDSLAEHPQISWAERHRHPEGSDELYAIIGDKDSIVCEITIGDNAEMETYEVASPGAVFIPAGVTHSIKPISMKPGTAGGIMAFVTNPEYLCLPPK